MPTRDARQLLVHDDLLHGRGGPAPRRWPVREEQSGVDQRILALRRRRALVQPAGRHVAPPGARPPLQGGPNPAARPVVPAELVHVEAGRPRAAPGLECRRPAQMQMGVVLPGVTDTAVNLDVVGSAHQVGREGDDGRGRAGDGGAGCGGAVCRRGVAARSRRRCGRRPRLRPSPTRPGPACRRTCA